jgi:calcineurin-like phosphoesterase family protein
MRKTTDGSFPTRSAQESTLFFSKTHQTILDGADTPVSSKSPRLSSLQSQVDGMVGGFAEQATDWRSLSAMMTGGIAYRLGRIGAVAAGTGHLVSAGIGLGAEVSAFEMTNRSLTALTGDGAFHPNLWRWEGQGGIRQGLLSSLITFGSLKGAGQLAQGENVMVQHLLQDTGMVLGHQVSGAFGIAERPHENLVEQFLHAEATNLQFGAGLALAHSLAPGLHGLERGLDLSLFSQTPPLSLWQLRTMGNLALATAGETPNSDPTGSPSPLPTNLLAMVSKKGEDEGKVIPFRRPEKMPIPADETSQAPQKHEGPVKIVALGDIHAKWPKVQSILKHEFPEGEGTVLSVGDLVSYPQLPQGIEFFFVHGNHENFKTVDALHRNGEPSLRNYHPIFAGDQVNLGGLTVAGLPGVFSDYYFLNPKEAPLGYWTPERVGAFGLLAHRVDILLMHEAPKDVGFTKDGEDLGNPLLTSLIEYLNPRLVFFGHHHQRFEGRLGETRIVGLDYPKRSYAVLEYDPQSQSLAWEFRLADKAPYGKSKRNMEFKFPWEPGGKEVTVVSSREVIPMDREKRIESLLKEKHVETVKDELTQTILAEIKDSKIEDKPFAARIRASSSINTVLPFVVRYAAALEAKPNLPLEKRQELIGKAYDEMTAGLMPQAAPDLVRAFEALLKALEIVKV